MWHKEASAEWPQKRPCAADEPSEEGARQAIRSERRGKPEQGRRQDRPKQGDRKTGRMAQRKTGSTDGYGKNDLVDGFERTLEGGNSVWKKRCSRSIKSAGISAFGSSSALCCRQWRRNCFCRFSRRWMTGCSCPTMWARTRSQRSTSSSRSRCLWTGLFSCLHPAGAPYVRIGWGRANRRRPSGAFPMSW